MPAIEFRDQNNEVRVREFSGESVVIGRHPECDVCLDRRNVSRQHCRILRHHGAWYVEDLNSLNGTFVNGKRVIGRCPLRDRDTLHIYKLSATFYLDRAPVRASQLAAAPSGWSNPDTPPEDEPQGPREPNILHSYAVDIHELPVTSSERKLHGVYQLMSILRDGADTEVMLPRFLDALFTIFPQARRGHVLFKAGEDQRVLLASKSRSDGAAGETTLGPIRNNIAEQVLADGIAVLGVDCSDEAHEVERDSIFEVVNRAAMYVPLLQQDGSPVGVAYLDTTEPDRRFQVDDLSVFASLAAVAGQLIEYACLHDARQIVQRRVDSAAE